MLWSDLSVGGDVMAGGKRDNKIIYFITFPIFSESKTSAYLKVTVSDSLASLRQIIY